MARRRPDHAQGLSGRNHEASWCASVRVAQPERAQRQLYLCGDAERVRRASTLDRKSPRNKVVKAATRARRHEEYNSISSSCFRVFVAKFVLYTSGTATSRASDMKERGMSENLKKPNP